MVIFKGMAYALFFKCFEAFDFSNAQNLDI